MIDHKRKIIFIHIPKCAGSSVEYFFDVKPFDWQMPNYTNLTGWCDKRKIHLHHATPKQLLETELISESIWNEYTKFSIVRNPWSRAYSDYIWLNRFNIVNCNFEDFLLRKGNLSKILTDKSHKSYRGDHLYPQVDFLKIDDKYALDYLIRFENLRIEFSEFLNFVGIQQKVLPHDKKSKKHFNHYSHFYKDSEIGLIETLYNEDIKFLAYEFEDRRDQISPLKKKILQIKRKLI